MLRVELGEKLKDAREQSGLSLYDVQEKTKIQKRYLEAIEEGNFTILPGSFYTRAFIREFALVVGLNPDVLLEEHAADLPTTKEEDFERLSRVQKHSKPGNSSKNSAIFSVIPKILTAALIIGIIAVVWYFLQKEVDPENEGPVDETNEVEFERNAEALEEGNAQTNEDNANEDEPAPEEGVEEEPEEQSEPEEEPEPTTKLTLVDQDDSGTPSSVFEVTKPEELVIKVETENNSWLDIKNADGDVFYSKNFTKDDSPAEFELTEENEIILNIGRSVDITVTVNGVPIEYPFDETKAENYHQVVTLKVVE